MENFFRKLYKLDILEMNILLIDFVFLGYDLIFSILNLLECIQCLCEMKNYISLKKKIFYKKLDILE